MKNPILELLVILLVCLCTTLHSATYVVSNTSEAGTGSLREAITLANTAGSGPHTIDLSSQLGTINLTSALPSITCNLTINGPLGVLTISNSSAGNFSILTIGAVVTVSINNLIINGGMQNNITNNGGALTMNQCSVIGATGSGIYCNQGSLSLTNCNILNNKGGSGIKVDNYTTTSTLQIINSTISGNTANEGGGIRFGGFGSISITNSTISLDSAISGGAIYALSLSSITINNSTIAHCKGNSFVGGVYLVSGSISLDVNNSILIGNTDFQSSDVQGNISASQGYNIIGRCSGTIGGTNNITNVTAADVINPTLANNGGLTLTHALVPCSYAVDAGTAAGSTTLDQRGNTRNGNVDIGAYETPNGTPVRTVISQHPTNATACSGSSQIFSISSNNSPTYQWQQKVPAGSFVNITNGGIYSGATSASLTLSDVTGLGGYEYRCILSTSGCFDLTSNAAILTLSSAPSISSQTTTPNFCNGSNGSINVIASPLGLNYQWQNEVSGTWTDLTNIAPYSNVTASILELNSINNAVDSTVYRCKISNSCGTIYSNPCSLFVVMPPAFVDHPVNSTICVGSSGTLSSNISEPVTNYTFKWQYFNGSSYQDLIADANHSNVDQLTLNLISVSIGLSNRQYRCAAFNYCNSTWYYSNTAILTVNSVTINSNPVNQTICPGSNTSFAISASSGLPLSYLWQYKLASGTFKNAINNAIFSGVSSNTLSVTSAPDSLKGAEFRCAVSTSCGTINSNTVMLSYNTGISYSGLSNQLFCAPGVQTFSVSALGVNSYQWQVNTGSGYTDLSDDAIYSGTHTSSLDLNASNGMTSYLYRCKLGSTLCSNAFENSNVVNLFTLPTTVFTQHPSNLSICENNVNAAQMSISYSGPAASFKWQVDNGSGFIDINETGVYAGSGGNVLILTNTPSVYNGNYYRCKITHPCGNEIFSNSGLLSVNSTSATVSSHPSGKAALVGSSVVFNIIATGTNLSYQWQLNSGSGFSNISDNGFYSNSNTKSLTVSNITLSMNGYLYRCVVSNACVSSVFTNSANLSVADLKICMVTNESATYKNIVVFDKPSNRTGIDSFFVYKETAVTNVYNRISKLHVNNDESSFLDNASNASQQSYSYKISIKYSDGSESALSARHKTMHLTINQGQNASTWNLIWTAYEGISVSSYLIYRGTNTSNMSLISAVSGSNTSYTDNSAPIASNVYYQIEILGTTCNSALRTATSYSSIRSNIAETANATTSIYSPDKESLYSIFPNPASESISVIGLNETSVIRILNPSGTLVKIHIGNSEIQVSELPKGMYIIEIFEEEITYRRKIVIQ